MKLNSKRRLRKELFTLSSNVESAAAKRPTGRILFTGSGTRVIDDLINHLPETLQLEKCVPMEIVFTRVLGKFYPHVVVVCLSDESEETHRLFLELIENSKYKELPIFAVGNNDDCDRFKRGMSTAKLRVFGRPFDASQFEEALCAAAAEAVEKEKSAQVDEVTEERAKQVAKSVQTQTHIEAQFEAHAQAVASSMAAQAAVPGGGAPTGAKTILVVDDDVRMLNVIKMYLQDLYEIVVVPSGKLALKYLSKKSADLVLLDYIMPEEDGPAVLRQIRQSSPQPNVPVVFLTGVAEKDMVLRGLEFRPNGYMLKPVTREALLEKVTEVLLGL